MLALATVAAPSARADEDAARDHDVLRMALLAAADPANPLNRVFIENRGRPGKEIVVHPTTAHRGSILFSIVDSLEAKGELAPGLAADLRRRDSMPPLALDAPALRHPLIVFEDLEAEPRQAWNDASTFGGISPQPWDLAGAFWKRHPESWGWAWPYRPGYAADGRTAVVLLGEGPAPHGMVAIYLLVQVEGGWRIVGQWREIFR